MLTYILPKCAVVPLFQQLDSPQSVASKPITSDFDTMMKDPVHGPTPLVIFSPFVDTAKGAVVASQNPGSYAEEVTKEPVKGIVAGEGIGALLGKTAELLLGGAKTGAPGIINPKYIIDTNVVVTDGKRLVNAGVDLAKPDVFGLDIASPIRKGKIAMPKIADKI